MKASNIDDATASEKFVLTSDTFDDLLRDALAGEEGYRGIGATSSYSSDDQAEPRCEEVDELLSRLAGYHALNAVTATLRECGQEARTFVNRRLRELVTQCSDRFFASAAWLFLFDEDEESLKAVHRHRINRQYHPVIQLDDERSMVARIARNREAYLINDAEKAEKEGFFLATPDLKSGSAMGVPLILHDGRLLGVLQLESFHKGGFLRGSTGGPRD